MSSGRLKGTDAAGLLLWHHIDVVQKSTLVACLTAERCLLPTVVYCIHVPDLLWVFGSICCRSLFVVRCCTLRQLEPCAGKAHCVKRRVVCILQSHQCTVHSGHLVNPNSMCFFAVSCIAACSLCLARLKSCARSLASWHGQRLRRRPRGVATGGARTGGALLKASTPMWTQRQ